MAVWSVIDFGSLFQGVDIAAEHYHPDKLSALKDLQKNGGELVCSFASSARVHAGSNILDGIPVFDLGAATSHILDAGQAIKDERVSVKKMVRAGDVLISRLRSYLRQVAIVPPVIKQAAVSTEFIVLHQKEQRNIAFLMPFLLSAPVQTILAWSQDGNEHPRYNEAVLLGLPIPNSVLDLSDSLNTLVEAAQQKASQARDVFQEAEAILTAALGLDRVDLTPRLFYEDTYAHAASAARFDAEYYSPRMQNVINTLSAGGKTIGDVVSLMKRRFKAIPGKPFDYIEIADIGTAGTAGSNTVAGEDTPSRATWIVKPGDIITTTVRPIRRLSAIILPEQDCFVCSSGFAVLRPRDIEPELLLTYLRLPLVAELLNLHTTASMYPAISTADLLRVPLQIPDERTRTTIASMVRVSLAARAESISLLDEAKNMVENAIVPLQSHIQT